MSEVQPHDSTWISTTSQLPARGQPVEFMLAARECPIVGIFSDGGFHSRWTHYAPELVCRWRGATGPERSLIEIAGHRAA